SEGGEQERTWCLPIVLGRALSFNSCGPFRFGSWLVHSRRQDEPFCGCRSLEKPSLELGNFCGVWKKFPCFVDGRTGLDRVACVQRVGRALQASRESAVANPGLKG